MYETNPKWNLGVPSLNFTKLKFQFSFSVIIINVQVFSGYCLYNRCRHRNSLAIDHIFICVLIILIVYYGI